MARTSRRGWIALVVASCFFGSNIGATAASSELVDTKQQLTALRRILRAVDTKPFQALDWHDLRLAARDDASVALIHDALRRSGRDPDDASEQGLWVVAAAGRPDTALAFYDGNVLARPDDKSLLAAACWARAGHGLDLSRAMEKCDAAVAAIDRGYVRVSRGKAQLQLGRDEGALRDFNVAIGDAAMRDHPMLIDGVYGRGIARLRLGDRGGRRDLDRAIAARARVATEFTDLGIVAPSETPADHPATGSFTVPSASRSSGP